jgi:NAD(P)-dependent dehydrogenase (short-subunit alcohol dehydrogenase family)
MMHSGDDRIRGKAGDVTDFQQTVAVMKYAVDTFGSIDYVFANAGATGWFVADFSKEPSEPDVSVTLDMVKGLANTVHAAAPLMQTQSAGRQSKDKAIIISGSDASFINFSLNPTYAMAKHAMNGAAYSYAEWLRPIGIRIVSASALHACRFAVLTLVKLHSVYYCHEHDVHCCHKLPRCVSLSWRNRIARMDYHGKVH